MFKSGKIEGVIVKNLRRFVDDRGWLIETFRQDKLEEMYFPVMGYVSMTNLNVARGPHEHVDQADNFAFIGPSNFNIYLWDNRKGSPTYMVKEILYAGEDSPKSVIIPPGVVHAYKNVGATQGMVLNFPNQLFAGRDKASPVDEIRHEADPHSIYTLD
jgi:dTDP-4-dehydrorhamnose 3,5-epimerase